MWVLVDSYLAVYIDLNKIFVFQMPLNLHLLIPQKKLQSVKNPRNTQEEEYLGETGRIKSQHLGGFLFRTFLAISPFQDFCQNRHLKYQEILCVLFVFSRTSPVRAKILE
jgi:hypothetical protein